MSKFVVPLSVPVQDWQDSEAVRDCILKQIALYRGFRDHFDIERIFSWNGSYEASKYHLIQVYQYRNSRKSIVLTAHTFADFLECSLILNGAYTVEFFDIYGILRMSYKIKSKILTIF